MDDDDDFDPSAFRGFTSESLPSAGDYFMDHPSRRLSQESLASVAEQVDSSDSEHDSREASPIRGNRFRVVRASKLSRRTSGPLSGFTQPARRWPQASQSSALTNPISESFE